MNPNLDVVYSEAWIAVDEDTPAILEVPEIPAGTYYTAQIVDEWAEITVNINDRTFPQQPHGAFALCLAGSSPSSPTVRCGSTCRRARPSCSRACRSARTSTRPSRCSTGSRCGPPARRGSSRPSRSSRSPTASRPARRCSRARSSIRRSRRPIAPGTPPSSRRACGRSRTSSRPIPPTRGRSTSWCARHLPRLHARAAQPQRGRQRLAHDRQPDRVRHRLSLPRDRELRRHLVELRHRGDLLPAPGRRDGRPADRRPRLRDPLRAPASPPASTSTGTGRSPCTHIPTCGSCPIRTASTRSATAPISPRTPTAASPSTSRRTNRRRPARQLASQHRARRGVDPGPASLSPRPDVLDGSWSPPAMTTVR